MTSPEFLNSLPETSSSSVESWKTKDGRELSALAITDFNNFLMNRPEHRTGDMVCVPANMKTAGTVCEVRYFGNNPKKDDVFHVRVNFRENTLEATTIQGDPGKIETLLKEFGMITTQE